jgi:hypothetical protein
MEYPEVARCHRFPSLPRRPIAGLQVHQRSAAGSRSRHAIRSARQRNVVIAGGRNASVIEDPVLRAGAVRGIDPDRVSGRGAVTLVIQPQSSGVLRSQCVSVAVYNAAAAAAVRAERDGVVGARRTSMQAVRVIVRIGILLGAVIVNVSDVRLPQLRPIPRNASGAAPIRASAAILRSAILRARTQAIVSAILQLAAREESTRAVRLGNFGEWIVNEL